MYGFIKNCSYSAGIIIRIAVLTHDVFSPVKSLGLIEEALKSLVTAEGAGPFGTGTNPLPRQVIKNHGIIQRGARSKQQSLQFHIPLDCEWHFPFCPFIPALSCRDFYSALLSC